MTSRFFVAACIVVASTACGGGESDGPASVNAGIGDGAAGGDAPGEAMASCEADYLGFAVGPSGSSVADAKSGVTAKVLEGSVPPNFGYNTWTIQLSDASGAPMPNARITWACAFMDVHGHGTNPKKVENLGGGQYKITDQNLRMFGPWEVRFWIDPTGAEAEYKPENAGVLGGMACNPTSGPMGVPSIEFKVCVPRSTGD
jgi:hypothetical protein